MTTLYLMCGPAGTGKSTWIEKEMRYQPGICVSRDKIRFSLVQENEPYFSREEDVFDDFIYNIQEAINDETCNNVFVDATHLTPSSRYKVLDRLNLTNVDIIPVNFIIPLELNYQRNDCRTGRARVPRSVINNMRAIFTPAAEGEKYTYKEIINIY